VSRYRFLGGFWGGVALLAILILGSWLMPHPLPAHTVFPPLGYVPPEPGTYALPVVKPATDGEVLDTDGASHRLFDYMHGKIVLLSFIYTRCSDARGCPLATRVLYAIEDALRHDATLASQVRLLTLSFDPAHDTPEIMRHYAGEPETPKTSELWQHLTTASPQALQPILHGYGQYVVPVLDAQGDFTGTYAHLLKVFLIDAQQRVRNIYSVDFLHPQVLINDIKTLLMAEDGA
jgi:cytochrome c peroxidase